MKQESLLSIDPPSIREVVLDRLNGLEYRQKAREQKRKRENAKAAARRVLRGGKKRQPKQERLPEAEEIPGMRQIKVTYRAVFQQLKSTAMICRAPVCVEVAETARGWISRSFETGKDFGFTVQPRADSAMKEAESRFVTMLSDEWAIFGKPPEGPPGLRLLQPEEFTAKDGKVYWYDLNDYTHVTSKEKPTPATPVAIYPAACGESPAFKQFISTKANIEPSCPGCAEYYRKEYAKH